MLDMLETRWGTGLGRSSRLPDPASHHLISVGEGVDHVLHLQRLPPGGLVLLCGWIRPTDPGSVKMTQT